MVQVQVSFGPIEFTNRHQVSPRQVSNCEYGLVDFGFGSIKELIHLVALFLHLLEFFADCVD